MRRRLLLAALPGLAHALPDDDDAVREGRVDFEESGRLIRFYEDGLHGYTYLEDPSEG